MTIFSITAFLFFSFSIIGCDDENQPPNDDLPECVVNLIENPTDSGLDPTRIEEYQYNGETVYYVAQGCCDAFNNVYDKKCEHICSPDGGKSGEGDGRCTDFFDTAIGGEVLWELKD